jgi:hypothetical protein
LHGAAQHFQSAPESAFDGSEGTVQNLSNLGLRQPLEVRQFDHFALSGIETVEGLHNRILMLDARRMGLRRKEEGIRLNGLE